MALLEGKVAVVTGAAQGLGLGMAAELGSQGATVVIADLQLEKANGAAAALATKGLKVTATQLDVTDSTSVDACFAGVAVEHGSVDILVNSAGLGQQLAPLTELEDAEWDRVVDVTLTGSFRCCRAAGAIMETQESGTIVNISSINGQNPAPLAGAYNVAKAGIISLTRTLALELAACESHTLLYCVASGRVALSSPSIRCGIYACGC